MNTSLNRIALLIEGEIASGDPDLIISGFNSIQEAEPGEITFLGNPRYAPALRKCRASAVLVDGQFADVPPGMAVVRVDNPTLKFSTVIQRFGPPKQSFDPGVHPTAVVSPKAQMNGDMTYVGPHVVIEEGAVIGDGSCIHAGAYIGRNTRLGLKCVIHTNAVIKERCKLGNRVVIHSGAIIGTDGFGYELSDGKHVKIDQVGIVQLDDDVEVGSCTTIDRARFGRTWIGEGTKIDNLVQIAHNCVIGKHCIIVAQVGISGSTRLGNFVTMAGQVGVAGHLHIGDQVTFLAKSGVTKDHIEPGAYTGFPARPLLEGRRMLAYPARVPELLDRMRELEDRLEALDGKKSTKRRKPKVEAEE
ncbi:MAG TPA: UDP-3-O-(3-hydroxymyristoyl)glucosamine N-acyltransferase [Candidatus Saccharimonadia bacterium]|nr:UDP-3-O-(3-hydroxymyristoyl)glucosamine N-acyltransferase [Candidatus Saccharimonadia bacterium]